MIRASICIAAYGKPLHLKRTLQSIYKQKPSFAYETIVVDDGTPDDSIRDICSLFPDVCYIRHNREPGYTNPAIARNLAYQRATGEILICQSDDVEHQGNTIQSLVNELHPGSFVIAHVLNTDESGTPVANPLVEFTGPNHRRPLFFLGSVYRNDVYAIGGNSEDFVTPGREDVFFSQCLIYGQKLQPMFSTRAIGHHLNHDRPGGTAAPSQEASLLYKRKLKEISDGLIAWVGGPRWSTIPKIVSTFWSGKMSWLRWLTLYSLRKLNPDYRIILYEPPNGYEHRRNWMTDERADEEVDGVDYRERLDELSIERVTWNPPLENLGKAQCSDLCEWQHLATLGGFYSDSDILWVRPLDELRAKLGICNAVFCLEDGALAIGFFAASPNNRLFQGVYETALNKGRSRDYQGFGTSSLYNYAGVFHRRLGLMAKGLRAIEELKHTHPTLSIQVLPDATVYPFNWLNIHSIFHDHKAVQKDTYGLHWFGGSKQAQAIGPRLTEEEWIWRADTTIGQVIRRILTI